MKTERGQEMFANIIPSPTEGLIVMLLVWLLVHTLRRDWTIEKRRKERDTQQGRNTHKQRMRFAERLLAVLKQAVADVGRTDIFLISHTHRAGDYIYSIVLDENVGGKLDRTHRGKNLLSVSINIGGANIEVDKQVLVWLRREEDYNLTKPHFYSYSVDDEYEIYERLRDYIRSLTSNGSPVPAQSSEL